MLRYLRFGWVLLFSAPLAFGGLLMGGPWTWIGIAAPMAVMLSGDWLLGDDLAAPALKWPRLLNTFLFAQVPVTFVAIVLIAWKAAPGDLFGIGALAQHATGWDVATGHHAGAGSLTGGLLAISLLLSVNFFIGHELVHRADERKPIEQFLLTGVLDRFERDVAPCGQLSTLQKVVQAPVTRNVRLQAVRLLDQERMRPTR